MNEQPQGLLFFPPTIALYSQSAYLDWYGTVEQAAIGVSGIRFLGPDNVNEDAAAESGRFPIIVSVNGSGDEATISACSAPTLADDEVAPFAWGLAVGRFSTSTTINPDNPDACSDFAQAAPGDCPYNPQIAMIALKDLGNRNSDRPDVNLYAVQPSEPGTGGLECANDTSVSGFLPKAFKSPNIDGFSPMNVTSLRAGSVLRAGDAFGNSVRVGSPKITRIGQHSQPQMVIQTPPSLIDYVLPSTEDSSSEAIVNFTRAPDFFYTEIQFETESSNTSATTQTTSHSSSFTETVGGEAKFGVPLVSSIDVKNKESWSQFHESNTSSQFSNYLFNALQEKGTIGADDQVFWTNTTFNVFHFPVIGETVCPASLTCDLSDPNDIVCDGGGSTANAVDLRSAPSPATAASASAAAPPPRCARRFPPTRTPARAASRATTSVARSCNNSCT